MAEKTAGKAPAAKKEKKKEHDQYKWGPFYYGGRIDIPMLVITVVLLIIGITVMFSASHVLSYRDNHGDSYKYASSQVRNAGIGLIAMFIISGLDYRIFAKEWHIHFFGKKRAISLAHIVLLGSMLLTALVIPFGIRNMVGGPKRWLRIGIVFQPSDVLKFGLIVFLAYYVTRHYSKMRHFTVGILKPGIILGMIAVLLMLQPHLSCTIIMAVIFLAMIIIGGANVRHVFTCIGIGVPMLLLLMQISGYSYYWERMTIDPLLDPSDTTYQTYQAILAVGSGGWLGKGFDNSTQKFYYLPEAQNDFVFAIGVEEFGFLGGLLIILLFMIFVFRGFYIGRHSSDRFGMMLATGVSLQVGAQALFNIGVNVSAIPNTGISLPFFSYGGTALIMLLCEIGVILSVSRRADLN